jgi:hypothetical protein
VQWQQRYELQPMMCGNHKLVMSCVIMDDVACVQDVVAAIEAIKDRVLSVDVAKTFTISG